MHITRTIILPAAAFALALGSVQAAEGEPRDVPNFNQMDRNNDGALTREEAAGNPRLADQFGQVDGDGDGRLSRAEYLAIMARQDLHNLRESLAEFIDPQGKPPLAAGGQTASDPQQQTQAAVPPAVSEQMVRNVQKQLQANSADPGPADGIWGPRTHQALRDFQQAQGLEASGQLDAATLAALGIEGEQSASAGAGASAGGAFEKADKNGDGSLNPEEFEVAVRNRQ